jgi:hypothetical protein
MSVHLLQEKIGARDENRRKTIALWMHDDKKIKNSNEVRINEA